MLPFIGGVTNTAPVYIGVPPVDAVYQLNTALGLFDDAVNVAVCPALTICIDGVTMIVGGMPLFGFTVTDPPALVGEVTPVLGSLASA